MATEYYDTATKTLSITSGEDQILKSITFPPRYYNPFCLQAVTINNEALDIISECREEAGTIELSAINHEIKKGDIIKLIIAFRPKPPKDNVYKQPNAGAYYAHTLMMLLEGKKSAQVLFNLKGTPIGTCESCRPPVSGDKYIFKVEKFTVQSDGGKLTEAEEVAQEVTVDAPFSFYIDEDAGEIYLDGEDIPEFNIPVVITPGQPATAIPVRGVSGEVYKGSYENGAIKFDDPAGIEVIISNSIHSYTQLVSDDIAIPEDYKTMDKYKDLDFNSINGSYTGTGAAFNEDAGTMTLVGGIIAVGSQFLSLENGVTGFEFKLTLSKIEKE